MRIPTLSILGALLVGPLATAQEFGPWHTLGRFPAKFDDGSTSAPLAPEKQLKLMSAGGAGPDLAATFDLQDKERLAWKRLTGDQGRSVLDVGALDLNALCPPPESRKGQMDDAVCYLYRRIDAPREMEVRATLGSDDGVKVWLNGNVIDEKHVLRALAPQDDAVTLRLASGANHLLVKVSQKNGAYSFQLRASTRIPQTAINDAIDRGVEFLVREQLLDGSWGCWESWGGGHAAFAAYTLQKCGLPASHPAVRMAMSVTEARPMDTTYALACLILALEPQTDPKARERMQDALAQLVDIQTSVGMWDYPVYPDGQKPPMDMSNTLYAALALRAAKKAGLEVPDPVWGRLAGGVLRCLSKPEVVGQQETRKLEIAGFSYRVGEHPFGSATTAGLSALAICEEYGGDKIPPAIRTKMAEAKVLGMQWLAHNMEWSNNPGHGTGHHYFWVYGLERVGALYRTETIGDVDWYWDGAEYLIKAQHDDGSWNPENYVDHQYLDTCLALLFLERATAPSTGETVRTGVHETKEKNADVRLRATGDTPLTVWVSAVNEAAAKELEREADGPLDVEKVEYFARFESKDAEAQLIGSSAGGAAKRSELQRFALRHAFDRRGKWFVRAKVHVRVPGASDPSALRVLTSPDLELDIAGVLDEARLAYAADPGRSLLFGAKFRAESSTQTGDEGAARVADGSYAKRWRCAKDDPLPWVRLVFDRPARADSLRITQALPRLVHATKPRVGRVTVVVNKTESFTVDLDPDVLAKTTLSFGQAIAVRELEVRLADCPGREVGKDPVGLSEIELFRGK